MNFAASFARKGVANLRKVWPENVIFKNVGTGTSGQQHSFAWHDHSWHKMYLLFLFYLVRLFSSKFSRFALYLLCVYSLLNKQKNNKKFKVIQYTDPCTLLPDPLKLNKRNNNWNEVLRLFFIWFVHKDK